MTASTAAAVPASAPAVTTTKSAATAMHSPTPVESAAARGGMCATKTAT